ncbi:hypothetical protein CPB83DRAFT_831956 [Crepidotus variabilis]|uniref:B-related factor 1 n=1 Tax=Crepidotus variabilis TaxID=179855 RepID=A0A9P6JUZ8_9AGAR|nr:hypothetical protein CPB83DRAFT_831956 [Crepidotus variabilis]
MPRTTECLQCGAGTEWNDEVGSAVCLSCGSLVDPSQSVLTNVLFENHDSNEFSLLDSAAAPALKSLRSGNNWDLAGQGKEARDRRNSFAIVEFIKSLAICLNAPGLSPRAMSLFNQAKSIAKFSWGRKAKLVAGACFAIALRESNRPDALLDISSVLSLPKNSVTREFTSVASILGLSMALVDPSTHIPNIQSHLTSEGLSSLPPALTKPLRALCLRSVANTAVSLSRLFIRLSADHDILRLPVPATACGIFILALEAENRGPLGLLGDLAHCLGNRYQISKSVVMTRYKTLQDEVASWVENVPWCDKYIPKKGRALVSKRLVVARGLKDVIKFQDEIWERKVKPSLNLEVNEEECDESHDEEADVLPRRPAQPPTQSKAPKALRQAQEFLLNPLASSTSSRWTRSRLTPTEAPLSLATYLLLNPSLTSTRLPTRLQLLATLRGGATEDRISDDELFADGELDRLLRSDTEVAHLREVFGWSEGDALANDENNEQNNKTGRPKSKRKRTDDSVEDPSDVEALGILSGSALRPYKKSRLNTEAFAQFMTEDCASLGDTQDFDELGMMGLSEAVNALDEILQNGNDSGDEDQSMAFQLSKLSPQRRVVPRILPHNKLPMECSSVNTEQEQGEVILDSWRPPSPGSGVTFNDSCYEEEYD